MNMLLNQFRSLIIAVLLHTLATGAAAEELTFQDLSNAWKIKTGMRKEAVLNIMGGEPAVGLKFTEDYGEWHYCQTVNGLNEYFAVFFSEIDLVLGTKRYVVGESNGLKPGPCEIGTRLGSFRLPQSVAEKLDYVTQAVLKGQPELVLSQAIQSFEKERTAEEKARVLRESERIAAAAAEEKLRESERVAAAKALAARRKRLLSLTSDGYPRWLEAQSIGEMREINSILPEGAVQIVQVNTTAMNELLEIIVLQNDMMIKLLQQQAEKE